MKKLPKKISITIIILTFLIGCASALIELGDYPAAINTFVVIVTWALAPFLSALVILGIFALVFFLEKKNFNWEKIYIFSLLIVLAFPFSNALVTFTEINKFAFVPFILVVIVILKLNDRYYR